METSSFNDFYTGFIWLASDFKYSSKILIRKFKYKLTLQLQDQLNSDIELPNTIFAPAKRCLSMYEEIQVIDQIRKKSKSSITV